jgi:energy-coupling factor transporter ATP-binding protein EcfA2
VIEFSEFSFTYAGESQPALNDLTIHIPSGQFCGVVGPNGAGKSTLCYALSGMIPHYFKGTVVGRVVSGGIDIAMSSLGTLTGKVGLVFQNPFNQISGSRFSVRSEVALGLENLGVPREEIITRVDHALAQAGLTEVAERSPFTLSGGQQQRLALTSILVMQPDVLILDEPTSQLDPVGTREVFSLLHELVDQRETTVIMVEHKLERLAEFADRVLVLQEGRLIAEGPPQTILTDPVIERIGVQPTRYTQAARGAQDRGLIAADRGLPITLRDALEFFDEIAV